MTATNIDAVIVHLHAIIATTRAEQSRAGYFAAIYLHVATKVKECIEDGLFAHPAFIERLNVAFFNRYFDAYDQYRRGEQPTESWLIAFEAARSSRPTIDQHLLLGINAHIMLDLGIAVARVATPAQLPAYRADFEKMTAVLLDLFEDVMKNLGRISPLLGLLDATLAGPKDALARFGMTRARAHAWNVALRLAPLSPADQLRQIYLLDRFVAALARMIWRPGPLIAPVAAIFRLNERGEVRQIIDALLPNSRNRKQPSARVLPLTELRPPPERVVILGGGVAALAAAFELTDPFHNPYHDRYQVTIYQLGWRLGGKGASGRNQHEEYYDRIEEHGLHAWFGFYENAFGMIRRCYDELGRPPDAPLARWYDAFKPLNTSALIDSIAGRHVAWPIHTPPNAEIPGSGGVLLPIRDYVTMALELLHSLYRQSEHAQANHAGPPLVPQQLLPLLAMLPQGMGADALRDGTQLLWSAFKLFEWAGQAPEEAIEWFGRQPLPLAAWLGQSADRLLHMLNHDLHALLHDLVLDLLARFMGWLWDDIGERVQQDVALYRIWIASNFIYANVRGMLADDVLGQGFAAINEFDYREWLAIHAFPDDGLMAGSEIVSAVYDSSFAYIDGRASFEAGSALKGLIRTVFTYRGAFGWKMQAGTGDVLFAPLYEVLKRRGVRFKFFHRVKQLRLADDPQRSVGAIVIGRQVAMRRDKAGDERDYQPLIDVKGLPCWPSEPLYEQIEGGEALRAAGVNLEAPYEPTEVEELTLRLGEHFDKVILGISIAALPAICGELIAHSQQWRDMVTNIKTVGTQAMQLWLRPTANELGWPEAGQPIMSFTYDKQRLPNAQNSWGNMSHLIPHEGWPTQHYPLSLAYFCSAMPDLAPLPGNDDPAAARATQAAADAWVTRTAREFLDKHVCVLWPQCTSPGRRPRFRWECLIDARKGRHTGADRLASQYLRANIFGSERYVLSVPGSSKYRLPANCPAEFPNLYLAGDWTDNGLNSGCMEAAVMSGMLASLALCGYPHRHMIIGVDF